MSIGRTVVGAALCGVVLALSCASAHASVLPDPAPTDVVSQVTSDVGDVVGGVTDTGTGVVDQVAPHTDPKHVIERVVGTVKKTVTEVVEQVAPQGGGSQPGSTGGPATDPSGNRRPRSGSRNATTDHHNARNRLDKTRSSSIRTDGRIYPAPLYSSPVVTVAQAGAGPRSLVGRIGHQIGRVARSIAFPALLALLVGAFLVIQNRIDKSDPKLVAWTGESDHELVVFE